MPSEIAQERLKSFVARIERLADDKDAITQDVREVYAEAKGEGFDTKILRRVVSRRRQGLKAAEAEDELLALYEAAVGEQLKLKFGEGDGVAGPPRRAPATSPAAA
jgi:uncharacterized protein (UPF0335 family)